MGDVSFEGPVSEETDTYIKFQTSEGIRGAKLNIKSVDIAIAESHTEDHDVESVVKDYECILSHLLEFKLEDMGETQQGWLAIKTRLPDINSVKGDKLKVWKLTEGKAPTKAIELYHDTLKDLLHETMYYRQTEEDLSILTDEPCQFVVTAETCRDVEVLVFAEVEDSNVRGETRNVNIFYYLCSVYDGNPAKQVICHKSSTLSYRYSL